MVYKRAKSLLREDRWLPASICLAVAVVGALMALGAIPCPSIRANLTAPHFAIGEGRGIHPGRVVWIHAPDATDWAGYNSPEHWWQTNHTDFAVVDEMLRQALRQLAGEPDEGRAWMALFTSFNQSRARGDRGYAAGEKIAIKINLTACNARGQEVDPVTYEKKAAIMNRIDNSPQMLLSLLRQLVWVAGVEPEDITLGDPTGLFPRYMWNFLQPEFPEVHYLDNKGGAGRTRAEFSTTQFNWSTPAAQGKRQDYVPTAFSDADYIINFALLKGHSAGITFCAKNQYGSLLRCPDGYLRDAGVISGYYDMHRTIPGGTEGNGMGRYRALVDLMGHPELGGKTLLYLVDGLFGGYYWEGIPRRWKSAPFGDGGQGDWPSSLFASQDPVAIDSVAYDFLLQEWPDIVSGGSGSPGSLKGGAEDYLHEAALADNAPSGIRYDPGRTGAALASLGTHEHWNNPVEKKYSRNLGLDEGIELVAVRVTRPVPLLALEKRGSNVVLSWQGALPEYRLQVANGFEAPVAWQTLDTRPTLVRDRNVITNSADPQHQFFRLLTGN